MATIAERDGRFRVMIRRKNIEISSTFSNLQTAEIWAKYKEELIDNIEAFDPPLKEIITLKDAIELKIRDAEEKGKKDIGDFKILLECFNKFLDIEIGKITYIDLLEYFELMMQTPITRGGIKNDPTTGLKKIPSIHTTFRKFSYLSTVFELIKSKGVEIENVALKLCQYMRPRLKT